MFFPVLLKKAPLRPPYECGLFDLPLDRYFTQFLEKHKLADFGLIIYDEAHRTTAATFAGEDGNKFVKITVS